MTILVPFKALAKRYPQLLGDMSKPTPIQQELLGIVRLLLSTMAVVDDDWYRKQYPDVSAAVDAGQYASTRQHFVENGYFEGRLPCRLSIDEAWYTTTYEDVMIGIEEGDISSAEDHFNLHGYAEGRLPVRI